jgi:hypothetical protein
MTLDHHAVERVKNLLKRQSERAHPHLASVGIHEADGAEPKVDYRGKKTDESLAEVAAQHELNGRSWLRTWFDENTAKLRKEMTEAMREEFDGDTDAVGRRAMIWAVDLRHWIASQEGHLEALSPRTVALKQLAGLSKPDVPLYATGQLVEAIKAMLDGSPA